MPCLRCYVDLALEASHGLQILLLRAKTADDLDRSAEVGKGPHAQHIHGLDVLDPLVGVLLKQRLEDGPRLLAVANEVVALSDLLRALTARERRTIEGDVADQVEGIVAAPDLLGQGVQENTALLELAEDGLLLLGVTPGLQEVIERGELLGDLLPGVVLERLGDQPAAGAVV